LEQDIEGSKVIVAGGPDLERLIKQYPDVFLLAPNSAKSLCFG
jgi:hypothetical protein